MEGLAAAASIIAVLQIAEAVGSALKRYYQGVRDARGDIKELYSAVKSLEVVLLELDKLAKSRSIDAAVLQSANGALQLCKADMQDLEDLLKFPHLFHGNKGRAVQLLKWPMKKVDAIKMTRTIERHKSTLTLELGVRNLASNIENFDIIKDIQRTVAVAQENSDRRAIVKWLSVVDPSKEHNAARDKHEATTGSWLINGDEFKTWIASENSLFWLTAGAGAGKSILCSTVIDAVQELSKTETNHAVAYWYFTFTDEEKQNVSNFLASIIVQLLHHRADIPQMLLDAYEKSISGAHRPSIAILQDMLKAVIEGFESVYILVDALDECPRLNGSRQKLLDKLQEILAWRMDMLHLFLTSRKETDIEAAILQCTEYVQNHRFIAPEGVKVQADVELFLTSRLKSHQFNKWPPKLKQEAKMVLSERGQGMFRLVALQLEELRRMARLSPKSIQTALYQLPRTLDAFYDRMLMGIDELHSKKALVAMQWLAFSARPLKLRELAEAMIIRPVDTPVLDPEDRFMEDFAVLDILPAGLVSVQTMKAITITHWTTSEQIRSTSARALTENLIENEESDDLPGYGDILIQFAHFSVKEYLLSARIADGSAAFYSLNEVRAHDQIALACVSYVSFLLDITQPPQSTEDLDDLVNYLTSLTDEFRLFHYAFEEWPYHLDQLGQNASSLVTNLSLRLLSKKIISSDLWQLLMSEYGFQVVRFRWAGGVFGNTSMEQNLLALDVESPIAYALWLGLPHLARQLIDHSQSWEAAWSKHDLDVQIPTRCLMRSAQTGRIPVLQLLLEHGVHVDADLQESPGRHALHFAVSYYQVGTTKFLIDAGADINARLQDDSVLRIAVSTRSTPLVELLLTARADPNVGNGEAIYLAAVNGQVDQARMLIDAGANVNVNNDKPDFRVPLYYAATQGGTAMVRFLLAAGADIKSQHSAQLRILQVLGEKKLEMSPIFRTAMAGLWEIIDWQKSHDLEIPDEIENIFGGRFWEEWGSSNATERIDYLKAVGLFVWRPGDG